MVNQLNHRLHRVLDDQDCDALRAHLTNGTENAVEIIVAEPRKGLVEQDQSGGRCAPTGSARPVTNVWRPGLVLLQAMSRVGAGV